jgi:hypothetical protein
MRASLAQGTEIENFAPVKMVDGIESLNRSDYCRKV